MNKTPDTKRDKYDEVLANLYKSYSLRGDFSEFTSIIRSAFPPPAEDARQCAENISTDCMKLVNEESCDNYDMEVDITKAAAEIESFAQSRVEPWREGVRAALEYSGNRWSEWGERAEHVGEMLDALLSDSPAKEAPK